MSNKKEPTETTEAKMVDGKIPNFANFAKLHFPLGCRISDEQRKKLEEIVKSVEKRKNK